MLQPTVDSAFGSRPRIPARAERLVADAPNSGVVKTFSNDTPTSESRSSVASQHRAALGATSTGSTRSNDERPARISIAMSSAPPSPIQPGTRAGQNGPPMPCTDESDGGHGGSMPPGNFVTRSIAQFSKRCRGLPLSQPAWPTGPCLSHRDWARCRRDCSASRRESGQCVQPGAKTERERVTTSPRRRPRRSLRLSLPPPARAWA
jgi:hypothetical protein